MSSPKSSRRPLALGVVGAAAALALLVAPLALAGDYNILCNGNPPPPHVNGLGQPFDSCSPLGAPGNAATYSYTLALTARAAWPYPGADSAAQCTQGGLRVSAVFRQTPSSCAVWAYTTTLAGRVHLNTANNTCGCPTSADPTWQ